MFGPDEVHGVLSGVTLGEEKVVLAEHPPRHPSEHHAHLGAGGDPAHRSEKTRETSAALAGPLENRAQQPAERRDVGVDPLFPGGDLRLGGPDQRTQARGLLDEVLGLGGDLLEVCDEPPERCPVNRDLAPPRYLPGDLLGHVPRDRLRWRRHLRIVGASAPRTTCGQSSALPALPPVFILCLCSWSIATAIRVRSPSGT